MIGLAAALLAVFALLWWGAVSAVRSLSEAIVLTRIEHDAEALVAAVGPTPQGHFRLREGRVTPIYRQPLSGHYFVLRLDDGSVQRSRSLWDEVLALDAMRPGAVVLDRRPGPAGQDLLVRSAGYTRAGRQFSLLVAEDLSPVNQRIHHGQRLALWLLGIALLAVLLIQRLVLRHGFRAVDQVRGAIAAVAQGSAQRVEVPTPAEIRPLVDAINRLLHSQQQRLQRSRQALGNLAHALKSPLSLLVHDLGQLPPDMLNRARLAAGATRIGELIERELRRARIAGDGPGRRFAPSTDLPELVAAMQQLHRDRHPDIQVGPLPVGALPFDYDDITELLGNLLDNACKWCDSLVRVTLEVDAAELVVTIDDDGPGVADTARAQLLRRGGRLDEREPGHGLGLSIVSDLVSDYRGELDFEASPQLGGLRVRVRLPLVPPVDGDTVLRSA